MDFREYYEDFNFLIKNRSYYLVGFHYGQISQKERFFNNKIWENGKESPEKVRDVKPGSLIFLKSFGIKKQSLTIHGVGLVQKNFQDGQSLQVHWLPFQELKVPVKGQYNEFIHKLKPQDYSLFNEFFRNQILSIFDLDQAKWELLYYWVKKEGYFKNTAFPLSDRFNINFDYDDSSLIIKENGDFLSDFFGSQIVNITGIVGENGAGKTNLMYSIIQRLCEYKPVVGEEYLMILFNGLEVVVLESLTTNGDKKNIAVNSDWSYTLESTERHKSLDGYRWDLSFTKRNWSHILQSYL